MGSAHGSLFARPTLDVDVCIVMPRGLQHRQDRKRFRYLYKRAAFLAFVASLLEGQDWVHSISYEQLQVSCALAPCVRFCRDSVVDANTLCARMLITIGLLLCFLAYCVCVHVCFFLSVFVCVCVCVLALFFLFVFGHVVLARATS